MPFYDFRQSNPGGERKFDESAGISTHVIIEADTVEIANRRAGEMGLYFNGVDSGIDCRCCGDRWSPVDTHDESPAPIAEGFEVAPNADCPAEDDPRCKGYPPTKWMSEGTPEGFIHYSDGSIEPFWEHTAERNDLDGSFGWGVRFSRTGAEVFLVGANGWDATGNLEAPQHKKRPVVELHTALGMWTWGSAWFPTEEEARTFQKTLAVAKGKMTRAINEIMQEEQNRTRSALVKKALQIWKS